MTDANIFYLLSIFDNNDCKSIFNSFSEDEFTVIYTKEIEYENSIHTAYFVFYSDLKKINCTLNAFILKINRFLLSSNYHFFLIYDLSLKQIIPYVSDYPIFSYYSHICVLTNYTYPSKLKRKHKKATERYMFLSGKKAILFIEKALHLIEKTDYYVPNTKTHEYFNILTKYFTKNYTYVVIALNNNAPCGIMCGFKNKKSVYMLCHFYDPLSCKNYINNGLYYSFIELCKQKHIESICFGSSYIHDSCLIHFKDYYSTEKKIYFSLIIPSANLF